MRDLMGFVWSASLKGISAITSHERSHLATEKISTVFKFVERVTGRNDKKTVQARDLSVVGR
jgi:hypothetical protein